MQEYPSLVDSPSKVVDQCLEYICLLENQNGGEDKLKEGGENGKGRGYLLDPQLHRFPCHLFPPKQFGLRAARPRY